MRQEIPTGLKEIRHLVSQIYIDSGPSNFVLVANTRSTLREVFGILIDQIGEEIPVTFVGPYQKDIPDIQKTVKRGRFLYWTWGAADSVAGKPELVKNSLRVRSWVRILENDQSPGHQELAVHLTRFTATIIGLVANSADEGLSLFTQNTKSEDESLAIKIKDSVDVLAFIDKVDSDFNVVLKRLPCANRENLISIG